MAMLNNQMVNRQMHPIFKATDVDNLPLSMALLVLPEIHEVPVILSFEACIVLRTLLRDP
jgi:hypothetical protein